jgi:threonine synthase
MSLESFQCGLSCLLCGKPYSNEQLRASCSKCGGSIVADYDYESIQGEMTREKLTMRPPGVWKYQELLPIASTANIVSLGEGGTYLHRAQRVAEKIGLRKLFIKDETTNPTGSFIDRGVTIEVSRAKELGYGGTVCGTTGNLGASLAAYSAKAGLKCRIFLPRRIDLGKFYQIITYGADIETTRDYEEALSKASKLEDASYLAFPGDSFFLEGLKTTGYEICEQIGWRTPRNIIIPMGDGGNLSMVWRGIKELIKIGLLDRTDVRMIGVQAQGAAPIVKAFLDKEPLVKPLTKSRTLAADIDMKKPLHGNLAVQAIVQSKGLATAVSDSSILNSASLLAKTEGIFAEPAAASTMAALLKLVESREIDRDEETVCVLTGTGLKDLSSVRRTMKGGKRVERLFEKVGEHAVATGITGTKRHILEILNEKESYGYGLWKKLRSNFNLDLSLPSVYQHLNELETMMLIERVRILGKPGKRQRYYYTLAEKGKVILKRSALID